MTEPHSAQKAEPQFYSAQEAAERLGIAYPTFLARSRKGKYNRVKVGWAVLFHKEEIDQHASNEAVEEAKG